jgi:large subunit ribosomal protein L21
MYAIVKTGGKQYRVEPGQRLLVERLPAEEGASVALAPILYRSEETVFDRAGLEKVKVNAKVLAHVRGEKLRVFKFKPKRGSRRRTGHRQDLTQIEVTEIAFGDVKAVAAPKPAAAKGKPAASAPAAETAVEAKPASKPAAKPATAKAKPAAKAAAAKPAAKAAAAKPTAKTAAAKPARKPAAKPAAAKAATKPKEEGGKDGA